MDWLVAGCCGLLLALVARPVYWGTVRQAEVVAARQDLAQVTQALQQYRQAQGTWPADRRNGWEDVLPVSLTTPLAYLYRLPAEDVLLDADSPEPGPLRGYRYHNWVDDGTGGVRLIEADRDVLMGWFGDWTTVSAGPDGRMDFFMLPLTPVWYDPTNGLFSRGDLFVSQQQAGR